MVYSISDKLRIKQEYNILAIHAPGNFKKGLGILPAGIKISDNTKTYNQVHWFVLNKEQLEKEMSRVMKLLKPGVLVWVYYPKGTSNIQTNLTRDKGWDCLMSESNKLTRVSLISFDDTWSVFGFRAKNEEHRKKEAKPKVEREIFKWVNPKTKEVKLPEDLAAILKKNKKQADFFNALSFTNKKEFIDWIVSAKREETRNERLKSTIERLGKGWKNPFNN